MDFLHAAWAFALAHGPSTIAFLFVILPTIITAATEHPDVVPEHALHVLQYVFQILSFLQHRDVPGWFKVPLTASAPPSGPYALPPAKGFARLPVLFAIAIGCLLSLAARAQAAVATPPNPDALAAAVAQDPAAVQPDPIPPAPVPAASQFGGCVSKGRVCFAPSIAIAIAAVNLRTKTIEAALSPGVGYGVTFNPGKWSSIGLDGYFVLDPGAKQASASFLASFFNGYLRAGFSKGLIGDTAPRVLFATGLAVP